jgi:hypothetical protein
MIKVTYSVSINATKAVVYKTMLQKPTYEQWTSIFGPTSTYEGSWLKGSKMSFFALDEEGNRQGLISEIMENIENTYVSICHKGTLKGETEIYESEDVDSWVDAMEEYTFTEEGIGTILTVNLDTLEAYQSYFDEQYPLALAKLKSICEV